MSMNTEANHENHVLSSQDALTELLRGGAQRLIAQAIEAELEQMRAEYQDITTITRHRAIVRSGFPLETNVLTEIGTVDVDVQKVRSLSGNGVKLTSRFLPMYLCRA